VIYLFELNVKLLCQKVNNIELSRFQTCTFISNELTSMQTKEKYK